VWCWVALAMQTAEGHEEGRAANIIQGERLTDLIEEYLREELHFDQARAAANALVKQLRERNFILCFLGGDSYAFVHRTFLEYSCATEFVYQFEKKKSLTLEGLLALYDAHCRDDDWQEVLRLICGQLDEQFAGKIIERLTERVDLEKWDKKTYLPELELATWCLSEVRNLNQIDEKIGAKLLLKIIDILLHGEHEEGTGEVFNAAKAVGMGWPGKTEFHFNRQCPRDSDLPSTLSWPDFLADIFRQRLWIKQLCFDYENDTGLGMLGAIKALIEYWPDDETREFARIFYKKNGIVASLYGEGHSLFGKYIFMLLTEDVSSDEKKIFIKISDPRRPIPSEHIQKAAKAAGIPPDRIDETVRSLSEHMGWDITKGSEAGKLP
ncbi:MAG: hypothetical protein D3919_15720, partial [Candidatus Electrothrix sp. AW5]|nr:hypothetical protein [Candidatus Electrothrix gigas]